MKERCSAKVGSNQCRATKHLTRTSLKVQSSSWLTLPEAVIVLLCPKHLQLRKLAEAQR